jgi:hypothetical protein
MWMPAGSLVEASRIGSIEQTIGSPIDFLMRHGKRLADDQDQPKG